MIAELGLEAHAFLPVSGSFFLLTYYLSVVTRLVEVLPHVLVNSASLTS